MLKAYHSDIKPSEITDREIYLKRRQFLQGGAALALGLTLPGCDASEPKPAASPPPTSPKKKLIAAKNEAFSVNETQTSYKDITRYNNFYEFSTDKEGPAKLSKAFVTRPWTIRVDGEVDKPQVFDIEDILKTFPLEERIYRLRCVEAWSMVVPWIGFALADLIKKTGPTSRAKYVAFETLYDPKQMPGQQTGLFGSGLKWPYVEGLRIDEAMHPLTLLSVGLYGEMLPNQNGAPIRLVVPWKYGFKSIKSIVKITLVEKQPPTTWNISAPGEYGFYSNVNPKVPHPRWSQARERRIGEFRKRETLMFNGYADQVASLYTGMDLKKYF
ncbi:MAG TPA: protein-methionine-sulfoxide reductase catalytic subunit MsrP [Acidiferrobacteraceae bacterium]|nr:protein-methionine-sulfoxide reductase catalytic subunit MsrP [Acidiferrobacteraceae bacterium]